MKRMARIGIVVLALLMMMSCTAPVPTPEKKSIDDFPAWLQETTWDIKMTLTGVLDEPIVSEQKNTLMPPEFCNLIKMGFDENAVGEAIATEDSYKADISQTRMMKNKDTGLDEPHEMQMKADFLRTGENCKGTLILKEKVKDKSATIKIDFELIEVK